MYICMYVWSSHIARSILLVFFPVPVRASEILVSRGDGFGSPVPPQPAHHLHTQAESGAY